MNRRCPECGDKIPKGCIKWFNSKNYCSQKCWKRAREVERIKRNAHKVKLRNTWMNKLVEEYCNK